MLEFGRRKTVRAVKPIKKGEEIFACYNGGEVSMLVLVLKTKEGLPLLAVETEAYGSQGVHMKMVIPWLVSWAHLCKQEIVVLSWLL